MQSNFWTTNKDYIIAAVTLVAAIIGAIGFSRILKKRIKNKVSNKMHIKDSNVFIENSNMGINQCEVQKSYGDKRVD